MVQDSSGRRGTNARKYDTTTTPSWRKPRANGKPARFPLGLQLSTSKVPAEPWPPRVRGEKKKLGPRPSLELCSLPEFGYVQVKALPGRPEGCVPPQTRYQAL